MFLATSADDAVTCDGAFSAAHCTEHLRPESRHAGIDVVQLAALAEGGGSCLITCQSCCVSGLARDWSRMPRTNKLPNELQNGECS
jgi:hypothetical protein